MVARNLRPNQDMKPDPRIALQFAPRVCAYLHAYFTGLTSPIQQSHDKETVALLAALIFYILNSMSLDILMPCACFTTPSAHAVASLTSITELEGACNHNELNLHCVSVYWHMILELLDSGQHHGSAAPGTRHIDTDIDTNLRITNLRVTNLQHNWQVSHPCVRSVSLHFAIMAVGALADSYAFRAAATHEALYIVETLRHYISHPDGAVSSVALRVLSVLLQDTGSIPPNVPADIIRSLSQALDLRSNSDEVCDHAIELLWQQAWSPTFHAQVYACGALGAVVRSMLSPHIAPMRYLELGVCLIRAATAQTEGTRIPAIQLDLLAALLMVRRKARAICDAAIAQGGDVGAWMHTIDELVGDGLAMLCWLCNDLEKSMRASRQEESALSFYLGCPGGLHWTRLPGESSTGGLMRAQQRWGALDCPSLWSRMVHRAEGVYKNAEREVQDVLMERHRAQAVDGSAGEADASGCADTADRGDSGNGGGAGGAAAAPGSAPKRRESSREKHRVVE